MNSIKGIPMLVSFILFNNYGLKIIFIITIVLFFQSNLFAQNNDTLQSKKLPIKIVGFPIIYYTPETRLAGGVYANFVYTGSPENNLSYIGFFGGISLNRQYSISLLPDLWWNNNSWHLNGELNWQYWPDNFYGLGNKTKKSEEEHYISKIKGIKLDLFKSLRAFIYAGLLFELEHNKIIEYDTVSFAKLPDGTIPGSTQSLISGIGIGLARD